MTASVLTLDKDQLKWLLKNKDLFTKEEIKVAAKCLVQKNKIKPYVLYDVKKQSDAILNTVRANNLTPRGQFYG